MVKLKRAGDMNYERDEERNSLNCFILFMLIELTRENLNNSI